MFNDAIKEGAHTVGMDIRQSEFSADEKHKFSKAVQGNLQQLRELLGRPAFGHGAASMGAELEMYIIDGNGRPLSINQLLLDDMKDTSLTLELNRYNLEFNLTPGELHSSAFSALEHEILQKTRRLASLAARRGGRIVSIGILPTLSESDFGAHCITDRQRYHALVKQLIMQRGSQFEININGADPLQMAMDNITLEGANTSFQIHYRVSPECYADTFNAIQLVTPLVLAVSANSPTLFGHRLWAETRIPLFKQSIDTRISDRYHWNQPARVNFGNGWVRDGAFELFQEAAMLYTPLLPVCSDRPAMQDSADQQAPTLDELRLHQSTVWLWNRPVYDDVNGGHLRIEMRALPAGPTAIDMVANAALFIGLAEGLRPDIKELLPGLPFATAEYNFYRAAQYGLDAQLIWPRKNQCRQERVPIVKLITELLPLAIQGLQRLGVSNDEASYYLAPIEKRLQNRVNGASWQLNTVRALEEHGDRESALHGMLEQYIEQSLNNTAIAEWPTRPQ